MTNDYLADRASSHDSIARFGRTLYLRRNGTDRPVTGAIVRRRPRERSGELTQFTERVALLSPVDVSVPPNHELDRLIDGVEILRIMAPVRKIAPAGTVIFWTADVVEIGFDPSEIEVELELALDLSVGIVLAGPSAFLVGLEIGLDLSIALHKSLPLSFSEVEVGLDIEELSMSPALPLLGLDVALDVAVSLELGATEVAFVASATALASSINLPGAAQAGHFALLFDRAQNAAGTPTQVVPSGWTLLQMGTDGGVGRQVVSYKQLSSADISAGVVNGMTGDASMGKALLIFDQPESAVVSNPFQVINGAPTNQSLTIAAVTPPIVCFSMHACNDSGNIGTDAMTGGAASTQVSVANWMKVRYKIFNSAPVNQTVSMGDSGSGNAMMSGYYRT